MFACTAYCAYLCSVFQEDIHKEISKDNVELKKRKVKDYEEIDDLAVALFSMTTTFAADENASATTATAAFNMNVNMNSLSDALGLNIDQVEAVADVHKNFTADMMNAATATAEDRAAMIDKAVIKDLKYMHSILNDAQYRKYVMLLNATLVNRGLK